MKSTVSVRWQTVVPQEIREAFKIEPNSKLEWEAKEGYIAVYPLPADPIRAARGLFKTGPKVDLLAERKRDLELDQEVERRYGIPPAPSRNND